MNQKLLINNAKIVNEGKIILGCVVVVNNRIEKIISQIVNPADFEDYRVIDAEGKYLLPGLIDDQVHFREPGHTHKADIATESKAAVAGGITSYMEMPNTFPNTTTNALLREKFEIAANSSMANYSFYLGATNSNIDELLQADLKHLCGVKIFLGSSTGNMLVNDIAVLENLFSKIEVPIAVHCEDEETITKNTKIYKEKYGEDTPISCHPEIRNEEACYKSSSFAVGLAKKYNTRLHLLHLSTAREMELLDNSIPLHKKRITSEVCVHHLWFNDQAYEKQGNFVRWNPAVKTENDRQQLFEAVLQDKIDVIATDHAPHLFEEKENSYFSAPSGGPLVQHSLNTMLEFYKEGKISLEKIVEKMCHAPAICFNVSERGFIREGYYADLVLVDMDEKWKVDKSNILYKCKWSPFEGVVFNTKISHTIVNGNVVYENGVVNEEHKGMLLSFNR